MALSKEDLQAIREIVKEEVNDITAPQFEAVNEKLDVILSSANESGKWIDKAASVVGIPFPAK